MVYYLHSRYDVIKENVRGNGSLFCTFFNCYYYYYYFVSLSKLDERIKIQKLRAGK